MLRAAKHNSNLTLTIITVNVLKFCTLLFVLFLKEMLVIRAAGIHKMHVIIANREDPEQTAV